MLSRSDVILAYMFILGRDPESEDVIDTHRQFDSVEVLRSALFGSEEFRSHQKIIDFKTEKWVYVGVFNNKYKMWIDLSDRYVSYGCLFDSYESIETATIKKYVKKGDRVCDLGANIGWHTLALADAVGPNGHVDAFEPRRPTFDYLSATISSNNLSNQVRLWNCGVWNRKEKSNITWATGTDNPGGSAINKNAKTGGFHKIELDTFDAMVSGKIDFIKIDIEGAEFNALAESKVVMSSRPIIMTEIYDAQLRAVSNSSAKEYLKLFLQRDYVCTSLNPEQQGERIVDVEQLNRQVNNVLLLPKERQG